MDEIERVQLAVKDLLAGDINAFGQKMYETHEGLSQLYEVSCRELDILVNAVKDHPQVLGARMMGGGFGGCTINIIKKSEVEAIIHTVADVYAQQTTHILKVHQVKIAPSYFIFNLNIYVKKSTTRFYFNACNFIFQSSMFIQ